MWSCEKSWLQLWKKESNLKWLTLLTIELMRRSQSTLTAHLMYKSTTLQNQVYLKEKFPTPTIIIKADKRVSDLYNGECKNLSKHFFTSELFKMALLHALKKGIWLKVKAKPILMKKMCSVHFGEDGAFGNVLTCSRMTKKDRFCWLPFGHFFVKIQHSRSPTHDFVVLCHLFLVSHHI